MFCKYCGKPIDNDSIYCRYCGRQIGGERETFKSLSSHSSRFKKKSITFNISRICITKEQFYTILNFIWKVLKSIVLAIVGMFVYILVGIFMSPLIALFNVEIPSLGFFDKIEKIWKKEKNKKDHGTIPF